MPVEYRPLVAEDLEQASYVEAVERAAEIFAMTHPPYCADMY